MSGSSTSSPSIAAAYSSPNTLTTIQEDSLPTKSSPGSIRRDASCTTCRARSIVPSQAR